MPQKPDERVLKSLYYEHDVYVFDNHDGDTLFAIIELFDGLYGMNSCRLMGLDTKELHSAVVQDRLLAQAARGWVARWITLHHHALPRTFSRPFPWPFRARIIEGSDRDRYGRYLLYLVCVECGEVLNETLLKAVSDEPGTRGLPLAVPYMVGAHKHITWARWVHENQVSARRQLPRK
jgi:hypothetical protein